MDWSFYNRLSGLTRRAPEPSSHTEPGSGPCRRIAVFRSARPRELLLIVIFGGLGIYLVIKGALQLT